MAESTVVVLPKENLKKDDETFMNLLPEEIWTAVLHKLNFEDKQAAINASLFFRRLFLPLQPVLLFPQVWDLLALRFELGWAGSLQKTPTPAQSKSWPTIVLDMRLVCKSWCSAIDSFYQNLNSHIIPMGSDMGGRELDIYNYDDKVQDFYISGREFSTWTSESFSREGLENNQSDLQKFLDHFEDSHGQTDRNPLVGRHVAFYPTCYCSTHVRCKIFSRMATFLERYGRHIWFCTLNAGATHGDHVQYISTVREWLEKMPNLRYLSWSYVQRSATRHTIDQIADELSERPLPRLPKLKQVELDGVPLGLAGHFLYHNDEVTVCQPGRLIYPCLLHLPAINQVSFVIDSRHTFQVVDTELQGIPLQKIELSFRGRYIEWDWIFDVLERYEATLTNVFLAMPEVKTEEETKELMSLKGRKLNLPHVKHLRLTLQSMELLKFFLPCGKSLELLDVQQEIEPDEESRIGTQNGFIVEHPEYGLENTMKRKRIQTIIKEEVAKEGELTGDLDYNLYKSNLWKVFPKLRRIDRRFRRYYMRQEAYFRRYVVD